MAARMNHEEAWSLIDSYADGELLGGEAEKVAAHIERCEECRRELERIRRFLARASSLPAEIDPERDLWPAIEGKIGRSPAATRSRRRRSLWRPPVRWAALAAALLIAIGFMSGLRDRDGAGVIAKAESVQRESPLARSAAMMTTLRKECGGTAQDAARSLGRPGGTGALHSVYEENAQLIDFAIAEVERAWVWNAGDPEMAHRLAHLCRMRAFLNVRIAGSVAWT